MGQMHGDKMNCAARVREFFQRDQLNVSRKDAKPQRSAGLEIQKLTLFASLRLCVIKIPKNAFMAHGSVRDF
jgi:hypothetical protein